MGNEGNNLEDLIGSSGGQPIVVQESGGDKKLLYALLIILLILFIIAIGVIAYLGGKYFGQKDMNQQVNGTTMTVSAPKQSAKPSKAAVATQAQNQTRKVSNSDIDALNKMLKEDEAAQREAKKTTTQSQNAQQQAIAKAATAASGSRALSQADLAKIAALVAKELQKSKVVSASAAANEKTSSGTNKKDAALVASLQNAKVDTLKEQQVSSGELNTNVKASSSKKVDTFNKVVVAKQQGSADDELAKLSQEIDTIVQSQEATQKGENTQTQAALLEEAKYRQKEMRFIVVKQGDTLSSIAYKAYGKASSYTKIYKANPDLVKNPNRIYIGMKLRVPVDEEYKKQQGK